MQRNTTLQALTEVIMKIRELAQHWEQNAAGRLSSPAMSCTWTWKPKRAWPR